MKMNIYSQNRTANCVSRKKKTAMSEPKDAMIKKQLESFDFFQNFNKKSQYSKNISKSLLRSITIRNISQGQIVAVMNIPIDIINFLINGEIAAYSVVPLKINERTPLENRIKEGDVFGIDRDAYEYTLKAITNCCLGQISKELFNEFMLKLNQYEPKSDIAFFTHHSIFKGLKGRNIEYLVKNIKKRELRKGEHVTTQGTPFNLLYIVKKGQVKLTYTKKTCHVNDFDMAFFQRLADDSDRFSDQRRCELMPSYSEVKVYPIFIVSSGDIIGDFELKYKMKNYCFNSICEIDNTILYEIKIDLFQRGLGDLFYERLKMSLVPKETLFLQRINTVVKNTKTPKSRYVSRFIDKMPKIEDDSAKQALTDTNTKSILLNGIKRKMRLSLDLTKMGKDIVLKKTIMKNESRNLIENELSARNNHQNSFASSLSNRTIHSTSRYNNKPKQKLFSTDILSKTKGCLYQTSQNKEDKFLRKLLHETKKKLFPKCFEVNKMFCLKNNPSIIEKDLNKIFMNRYDSNKTNFS